MTEHTGWGIVLALFVIAHAQDHTRLDLWHGYSIQPGRFLSTVGMLYALLMVVRTIR